MCFDLDSHPPIPPIAGGALDSSRPTLDRGRRQPRGGVPGAGRWPGGAAVVLLPDVRGLHPFYEELALRFAEHGIDALAIDWFGRTAPDDDRGEGFEYMPHVAATTWGGISADIAAGAGTCRSTAAARRPAAARGLHARLLHGRADVVPGGTLGSAWRASSGSTARSPVRGATTPRRRWTWPASIASPVLGLFGGADGAITPEAIAAFDAALTSTGTPHRLVSYEGAPHSFFDRKAAEFADASASAWAETLAFIADPGRAVAGPRPAKDQRPDPGEPDGRDAEERECEPDDRRVVVRRARDGRVGEEAGLLAVVQTRRRLPRQDDGERDHEQRPDHRDREHASADLAHSRLPRSFRRRDPAPIRVSPQRRGS